MFHSLRYILVLVALCALVGAVPAAEAEGHPPHDHDTEQCRKHADAENNTYFVIPAINDDPLPPTPEPYAAFGVFAAPPLLHSRPAASQKLYLNFTGCAPRSWGGKTAFSPPYDTDGDGSGFSVGELNSMYEIWQRVSEDFAPFNLDVTTEPPPAFTSKVALEVCIGGSSSTWYGSSAGGVAYLFSWAWQPTSAVWVFEDNLGNGNAKYTAEAASHEIGHAFGLQHSTTWTAAVPPCTIVENYSTGTGSGETGWAPLMGVGYYKNRSTFHNGPTYTCDNSQDDLAIIASVSNNVTYASDDFVGTIAGAANLNLSGTSVTHAGVIAPISDVDMFKFETGNGTVTLAADNFEPGPNLDIRLRLLNSSGTQLAISDSASDLDASFSTSLAAGTYYLEVSSSGIYGSLGQYTISGTIQPTGAPDTVAPTASLISAPVVSAGGGTSYQFTVRYQDSSGINVSSLNSGDILITKAPSVSTTAAFVSVDVASNGTPRTATYSFVPPGGNWDTSDNGTYSLSVQGSQVSDTAGNVAVAGALGSFQVSITVTDSDSDGITDASDNCPVVSNASQTNTDGDSQGDACDPDDDNDGTADGSDCAPLDATRYRSQAYADSDQDAVRNSTSLTTLSCFGSVPAGYTLNTNGPDNCPAVANAGQQNYDGDAAGDACDSDDDNDGTPDTSDCADFDASRYRDAAFPDGDQDGVANSLIPTVSTCYGATAPSGFVASAGATADNCPGTQNTDQRNTDGDSEGDACDANDDNDSAVDSADCAPLDASRYRNQAYPDTDGDGVAESLTAASVACFGSAAPAGFTAQQPAAVDNCPTASNPTQEDSDADGAGDACDSGTTPPPPTPTPTPTPTPPEPQPRGPSRAAADYDGDGITDLLLHAFNTNQFYQVNSATGTKALTLGEVGEVAVSGEFTGDPLWDLATVRTAGGGIVWRVLDNFTGVESEFAFGFAGDLVLSGCDFTGDGHTDAAVLRGGQLIYRDSTTLQAVAPGLVLTAGVDIATLVCENVSGDARAEILVLETKLSRKVQSYTSRSANINVYASTGALISSVKATTPSSVMTLDITGDGIPDWGYVQGSRTGWNLIQEIRLSAKKSRTVKTYLGMNPSISTPGRFPATTGVTADGSLMAIPGGALYVLNSINRVPLFAGQQPPGTSIIPSMRVVAVP